MTPIYDCIGQFYTKFRHPDLRIVDRIIHLLALEKDSIIADIGAGTGNYSRAIGDCGFFIRAIEPSSVMRQQASQHPRVQWIESYAENIPLETASVDASICVLASHHFSNLKKAVQEMHRVMKKGPVVFLTFDPKADNNFWLFDYFPSFKQFDSQLFLPIDEFTKLIETSTNRQVEISTFWLPHDLTDMFAAAGWRRPEIYLNPKIRKCISAFALADANLVEQGIKLLKEDLNSGRWKAEYGAIEELEEIDLGYRFLGARLS
ncbi:methyltransferase domain-containing protein [Candidatus Gracilibacteria bacterium]|nr:methyltransferase domain-containing protein [Candidatus Gracilibacteria bacterium]NJM86507.1 methyltransferase domain-containing protein [Hydrococcus sp. RU_2_2]